MRGRDWRRYKEEQKIISRLKNLSRKNYYRFIEANGNSIENFRWMDFIGTYTHFMYKTYTSKDSKWKERYGKKGRGYKRWSSDSKIGNRQTNKIRFKKMLEEHYGIKHLNISYGFIQNYTTEQPMDSI